MDWRVHNDAITPVEFEVYMCSHHDHYLPVVINIPAARQSVNQDKVAGIEPSVSTERVHESFPILISDVSHKKDNAVLERRMQPESVLPKRRPLGTPNSLRFDPPPQETHSKCDGVLG